MMFKGSGNNIQNPWKRPKEYMISVKLFVRLSFILIQKPPDIKIDIVQLSNSQFASILKWINEKLNDPKYLDL